MVSADLLRQLILQQKIQIEKGGSFIGRAILPKVPEAFSDNRVLIRTEGAGAHAMPRDSCTKAPCSGSGSGQAGPGSGLPDR